MESPSLFLFVCLVEIDLSVATTALVRMIRTEAEGGLRALSLCRSVLLAWRHRERVVRSHH